MIGAMGEIPVLLERGFAPLSMAMIVVILMVVGLGGLVRVQVAAMVCCVTDLFWCGSEV